MRIIAVGWLAGDACQARLMPIERQQTNQINSLIVISQYDYNRIFCIKFVNFIHWPYMFIIPCTRATALCLLQIVICLLIFFQISNRRIFASLFGWKMVVCGIDGRLRKTRTIDV